MCWTCLRGGRRFKESSFKTGEEVTKQRFRGPQAVVDREGNTLVRGSEIRFTPKVIPGVRSPATSRTGVVLGGDSSGVEVILSGDPFSICVESSQVIALGKKNPEHHLLVSPTSKHPQGKDHPMPTATQTSAKELRRQAKLAGISGWETMDRTQLRAALKENNKDSDNGTASPARKVSKRQRENAAVAKRVAEKNSAKTKSKTQDRPAAENGNPYAPGTNLFTIAEELIKGGKRSAMVARLSKKITLRPRSDTKDFDNDFELDRRILIVGQLLRKDHSFEVVRDGRGTDATIQAIPPAA